ncbi:glutamine--tRNA ligase/YqeY domain fusion protein [bacterium]|nr:glutamine--tRNA ligase/YqeY domain fusion protein [bacterium]
MSADHDTTTPASGSPEKSDFIRAFVREDLAAGRNDGRVHTRFPPEPNGYLHVGHTKAILLNWEIAQEFGGKFNLRFDDTNPEKEETEYVDSIKADVRWLGADWEDREFYASDYFETLYAWAVHLIEHGKAFVCSQTIDEVRATRGTVKEPGTPSPDRDRPVAESLDLFARMRAGEFDEGAYTLRARIDMAHPNMKMRDPLLYRIRKAHHHRTGDTWCIYPFYDFAHGQSDAIEGITHSLCTLEFEVNRPLYDWFIQNLPVPFTPRQIEMARLNLTYTVMSKRKLLRLVQEGHVTGWDDPRMPTISGLRRLGYTPTAIRKFNDRIGVAKRDSTVDLDLLKWSIRDELNQSADRVMAVLEPLKVVITNYPEGQVEQIECENNPEDPQAGTRLVPFSRELYIEQEDFREEAPRKFFRLKLGGEVRLKHAYFITCDEVIKDADGNPIELRCTYDPATRGGDSPDGRKVKGTLHWVSAPHAVDAEVRLYDNLFREPFPEEGGDYIANLNPDSLAVVQAKLEPGLAGKETGYSCQFLRLGYFCIDSRDSTPDRMVWNRTATLKDTWAKLEAKGGGQ